MSVSQTCNFSITKQSYDEIDYHLEIIRRAETQVAVYGVGGCSDEIY